MKAYQLTIAAAAAGLLVAASGPATAASLSHAAPAPLALGQFDGTVEPVHYRRPVRRHYSRYYRRGPVIGFGYSPYPYAYASPYYARPYAYPYAYGGYPYGYGPSFSFGFRLR
jgi:hypothetical protein